MTPELVLLKGLLKKPQFRDFRPFIGADMFTSEEHKLLLEIIDDEHGKNDEGNVSLDAVLVRTKLHSNRHPTIQIVCDQLEKLDVTDAVYSEVFETIKQRNLANQIALKAIGVTEGRESFQDLVSFVETHKATKVADISDLNELAWDTLKERLNKQDVSGLRWRLKWLNKAVGPIYNGALIHVFAVVETGKTAFWVSEVTHMIQQTDKHIVIFFNEEDASGTQLRLISGMLGLDAKTILTDFDRYYQQYLDLGGCRIKFIHQPHFNLGDIRRVLETVKPALAVVDNSDKVQVKEDERRDLAIHAIYKGLRSMAIEYCPIISVAHADASAYGHKYLDESMMAGSKVGKPAELDLIIGIGREEGEAVARYLTLPKNKLRGDKDTVEQLRHGRWPVALHSEINRYVDTSNE